MKKNLFQNRIQLNKTSSQFYKKLSNGNNTNNYNNIKDITNNGIYNKNFSNYLKNKTNKVFKTNKALNKNENKDIHVNKKNGKIIPKDIKNISMKDISLNHQINPMKKDVYNNSNISSYNMSSISTNKKEENKKMKSPVKK